MNGDPLEADLRKAFQTFVASVEEQWFEESMHDPGNPLSCAYYAFRRALNVEVR